MDTKKEKHSRSQVLAFGRSGVMVHEVAPTPRLRFFCQRHKFNVLRRLRSVRERAFYRGQIVGAHGD